MTVERVAARGEVGVPTGVEEPYSRRQRPALAPMALTFLNRPGTERLMPVLTELTQEQRIEKAIHVFEELARIEGTPQRQWSLKYFEACRGGPKARRDFLIGENVFGGGEYLYCPPAVRPQMEIANLNPDNYPSPFREEVEDLVWGMFGEYFGVKNALSRPSAADAIALMRRMPRLGAFLDRVHFLPSPRLKDSLLLQPYTNRIIREARSPEGKKVIAVLGPGKGEELVKLAQAKEVGAILCLDAHDGCILQTMFQETFEQARVAVPAIEIVKRPEQIERRDVESAIRQAEDKKVVFICRVDFSQELPLNLYEMADLAVCIYVLHESDRRGQQAILRNMARLSRGSVIAYDGLPTCEALDNVVLPVSDSLRVPRTGHDSVVTHLLCSPPDRLREVAEEAGTGLRWEVEIEKPPIGAPFLYPLQVRAIGRVR